MNKAELLFAICQNINHLMFVHLRHCAKHWQSWPLETTIKKASQQSLKLGEKVFRWKCNCGKRERPKVFLVFHARKLVPLILASASSSANGSHSSNFVRFYCTKNEFGSKLSKSVRCFIKPSDKIMDFWCRQWNLVDMNDALAKRAIFGYFFSFFEEKTWDEHIFYQILYVQSRSCWRLLNLRERERYYAQQRRKKP